MGRPHVAFLLVRTNYKPKFHDIEKLGKCAAAKMNEMLRIFPCGADEEELRFELLRRAYVDARFDKKYAITREELGYLVGRLRELRSLTESARWRKTEGLGTWVPRRTGRPHSAIDRRRTSPSAKIMDHCSGRPATTSMEISWVEPSKPRKRTVCSPTGSMTR